jgi:hypothetical protein
MGAGVFFFIKGLDPSHHEIVAVHHLGAAAEAEDGKDVGR